MFAPPTLMVMVRSSPAASFPYVSREWVAWYHFKTKKSDMSGNS